MQDVLKNGFGNLFIAILASLLLAPIIITLLYRFNQVSKSRKEKLRENNITNTIILNLIDTQRADGTPNMGGVIILLLLPVLSFILLDLTPVLKILLLGFVITGIWGVINVVIFTNFLKNNQRFEAIKRKLSWKLFKIFVVTCINYLVIIMAYQRGFIESLSISDTILITVSPILIIILSLIGQFATYSAQLSDGLDGLMTGMFTIINIAFIILFLVQGIYTYIPILMILLGILIVILYFNIPPSRFWNGAAGSMPLGFFFFFLSLITNNIIPYFLITSIIWIILLSSIIQALSFKIWKKRVFKIAPLHHHFQAIGWPPYKIVMRFWLFTAIVSAIGIYFSLI